MTKTKKPTPKPPERQAPQFDDVLKRMLSAPPEPKVKPVRRDKSADLLKPIRKE